MDSQHKYNDAEKVRTYLDATTNQEAETISNTISLGTLINCILDSQFTVLSDQKLTFFSLFKSKVLASARQSLQMQQGQSISSSQPKKLTNQFSFANLICPLRLLIDHNNIFLYNQNQWKSYLELLLKLILGQGYSLNLNQQKKYNFLKIFLENMVNGKEKVENPKKIVQSTSKNDFLPEGLHEHLPSSKKSSLRQIIDFISGLKSQGMFRQLFRTCSSLKHYHFLFDLCFIFLCHLHIRKVGDNDQKAIYTFMSQFCVHSTIDDTNVQVYFKLLKNYANLFFKEISQTMLNLLLKASSLMFIKKINHQETQQNLQNKRQIEKITEKLNHIIIEIRSHDLLKKGSKRISQSLFNLKNFEYFFIANALLGKKFSENLSKRLDMEFTGKILLKMFSTLNLASKIESSYVFFTFLSSALQFIYCAIEKTKEYPQKVLRFAQTGSFFSINILSECEISVKLKVQNCKESVSLFELIYKNKRIQIFQQLIDSKLIKFFCSETVKNQTKFMESQQVLDFETCQQFVLTFEKNKLTFQAFKYVKNTFQPIKIFDFQKFQSVNSRFSIGSSQRQQQTGPKIEQLQKLVISTKIVKKDKKQSIDKVNMLNLVTDNLYKGQINAKSNELKIYGIKMNRISLVEYPTDIKLFSSCYNVKYILEKAFSSNLGHFLSKKQQVDKFVEKNLIQTTLKQFIMLLAKIETPKDTFDNILKIVLSLFLEKFQVDCKDSQQRKSLFLWIIEFIQMEQISFERVHQAEKESLMMRFFQSIMLCSLNLFVLTIEYFVENLQKFMSKSLENSFEIVNKLTLGASFLVSDVKITKEDKNMLIQKIDMLFKLVRENLSNQLIKKEEQKILQTSIRLVIQVLTLERYDNETHEKMRRFKLSYILINFIKNTFPLLDWDLDQKGSVANSILKLCVNKVKSLKEVICNDESQSQAKIMDDMVIKVEDSFIFEGVTIDTLIEDISEMPITDFMASRHVHQLLKDKILVYSNYLELYFYVGNCLLMKVCSQKKGTLGTFLNYLEKLFVNFDVGTIIMPSLFYSELVTKAWTYFIRMFENSSYEKNYDDLQTNALQILEILGKFNFDLLTPVTLIRIAKAFIYHPEFLLSSALNWKLQVRLNTLFSIPWLIKEISQKTETYSHFKNIKVQKSFFTLLFRTILTSELLSQIQISDLHEVFYNSSFLVPIELLIITRQLSDASVFFTFGTQKCKQLFNTHLEKIKLLIFLCHQKVKKIKSESITDNQSSTSYEITIKKLQTILSYLKEQKQKLSALPNKDFDPQIFYNSQVLEVIEEYVAKMVRIFEIEAIQNQQYIKGKIKTQKQKLSFLEQSKLQPLKEEKDKKTKQIVQKASNTKPEPSFKKLVPGNEVKRQQRAMKRPMQIIVNPQKVQKMTCAQIFMDHIQNLSQTIQSLQKLLSDDQFHGAISFKQQTIFFTNENLNEMEERNAHFEYVIDEYCDINGFKPFIKRKEVNANLPKMTIQNSQCVKDAYDFKSILEHLRGMKQICDSKQIKAMPNSPKFRPPQAGIDSYVDSFKVTYITSSQFYQGELRVYNYFLCKFVQNKDIDPQIYGRLMALESEKRKKCDIQKAPLSFLIKFDKNEDQFIKKSYLKVENSIQIYSSNRSYFFVFRDTKQRDSFCKKIEEKKEINPQNVDIYIKLWQKGIISNFEYLMFLNKYSQRSFSDISQYYVFPWTVCNYKAKTMDSEFMAQNQNFRDLSQPIGKINKIKFNRIMAQFQTSRKFKDPNRHFLYGSFYSNPAITSYYLIRLYPFSSHQYELQSYKFDHADRLFGCIENNFDAVCNANNDFKELLPEFYSNPYFLKNKNRYNFGLTQKKVLIDNVELPSWVRSKTPEEFIFRMRKCLECQQVTLKLQHWIDLTFGVYAEKSQALVKDNLYNENVYGSEQTIKDITTLSFCCKYLKQFGQTPKVILKSQHPQNLMKPKARKMLKKSKSLPDILKETLTKQDIKDYTYDECQKLGEDTESTMIKFIYKERSQKDQKTNTQAKQSTKIAPLAQKEQTLVDYPFLILKENCVMANCYYGFGYFISPFDSKDPSEYKCKLTTVENCEFLTIDHAKNLQTYLLTIESGSLCAYKFVTKMSRGFKSSIGEKIDINTKSDVKTVKSIGSYLILVNSLDEVKLYLTQPFQNDKKLAESLSKDEQKMKNPDVLKIQNFILPHGKTIKADFEQIVDVYANSYLSIFCIRNKAETFYIFDARDDLKVDFRTKFEVYLTFEEKIKHVLIHNMGYILILTSKSRFLFLNMLAEVVLNVMVSFEVAKVKETLESIEAVCFWSQEASDIVFSTNRGMLYKVDIFDMAGRRQSQSESASKPSLNIDEFSVFSQRAQSLVERYELSEGKQKIVDIKMERTGRHWKMYCLSEKGNIFTLKNKYFDITKCMKIFLRERED